MNRQYPIGKISYSENYSSNDREEWIDDIALLPDRIRNEIEGCSDDILMIPYREGGWTVRQVIEHLADSHMNLIIRIKTALTEDAPTIRAYDEAAWAELGFQFNMPLELLENIHEILMRIYQSLDEDQWHRTFTNPESGITFTLAHSAAFYAWHSNHHLAHIRLVTQSEE